MMLVLVILLGGSLLELGLWLVTASFLRKTMVSLTVLSLAASGSYLFCGYPGVLTALIAIACYYRIFNLLRFIKQRMQTDNLNVVSRLTSYNLLAAQLLLMAMLAIAHQANITRGVYWLLLISLQLIGATVLFATTRRQLRTTQPPLLTESYADKDLPTLTVAIPARNETEDLEACLRTLIGSTYPKLEILVLDDCSQNKRTPEIIRGFAHDGVRFVAGTMPPEHWLAKNHAYEQLAHEANGEYILFCGVDARFGSESLRCLIEAMLQKKKTMVSLLPVNTPPAPLSMESLFIQPNRYAWELSLPRRWLNRPPVLSTCWVIARDSLHAAGGFKAVSRSISPESFFARYSLKRNDGYSFMQSNSQIVFSCEKSFLEQRATAIRTRYPQLHRRPELVAYVSILETVLLVAPYGLLITAIARHDWALTTISLMTCLLLTAFYSQIVSLTYRRFLNRSLWLLPFAALYDVAVLNYSMWKYEFSDVVWKDRNVCVPVMRVVPTLPKLPR